ncbi:hypothetical protein B0H66DRAFT_108127 [Apodospora peruviana]|uniref:Uncharacterized protein n=1 Tax=Apodospora peruviana TaxID=516989 RepID=A0AAE0IH85_9PEZI|nr:hypothetical protein B0H66DRAFT_108127 [Apodospora peruviana]
MVSSLVTLFLLCLLAATSLAVANNGNCYYPNGTMSDTHRPCDPNSEISVCCNGKFGYACMENNLCNKGGKMVRGTCTDPKWESQDHCPQFCTEPQYIDQNPFVISCENVTNKDYSYVCPNDSCNGARVFSAKPEHARIIAQWDTSLDQFVAVLSTTTAASSSSSVPTATPSSTPGNDPAQGLSTGAKAGIAVGAVLGCAALAGAFFTYYHHRRRAAKSSGQQHPEAPPAYPGEDYKDVPPADGAVEAHATPLVEANPTPLAAEAHMTPLAEMPGDVVSSSSGVFEVPAETPEEKYSEHHQHGRGLDSHDRRST